MDSLLSWEAIKHFLQDFVALAEMAEHQYEYAPDASERPEECESPSISTSSMEIFDLQDDLVLEKIYNDVDFNFDLKGVHSDAGNLLQTFIKREVMKKSLKKQYTKLKEATATRTQQLMRKKKSFEQRKKEQTEYVQQALLDKKRQLEEKIHAPPFLRTSDKVAFTVGVIVLCITEFILIKSPQLMHYWYTALFFPLLAARYYFYHKVKYHYFLLDFCYYVQLFLLVYVHFMDVNPAFFQVLFSACNGPLAVGIVMWRNSLVFHDLDKLTSVFIHMFPPLVTFSMRWFPVNGDLSRVCMDKDCKMSSYYAFFLTMAFYSVWQIIYILKTELIDKHKLDNDKEIMTSARWMTEVKPHPIYKFLLQIGMNFQPYILLAGVQFIYTILTLLPIILVFENFELHVAYLLILFVTCVWNGASFYFEVFTETYSKRLTR